MPTNPLEMPTEFDDQQAAVDRCQQLMAHAWMVRTFIKHSEEVDDFPELMGIVRAVFDTSRALETRVDDPPGYLKMLSKKIGKLKRATQQFADDARQASTHTNFQQAVFSIQSVCEELDHISQSYSLKQNYQAAVKPFNTLLREKSLKVVFAESCTGGLLSSELTQYPGISEFLCGSAVTYRNATKSSWLNVNQQDLDDPEIGPVSEQIVQQMLSGVLSNTAEADIAMAVTGHLGPTDGHLDGIVYVGFELRGSLPQVIRVDLKEEYQPNNDKALREQRRRYLAERIFQWAVERIQSLEDN